MNLVGVGGRHTIQSITTCLHTTWYLAFSDLIHGRNPAAKLEGAVRKRSRTRPGKATPLPLSAHKGCSPDTDAEILNPHVRQTSGKQAAVVKYFPVII